MHSHTQPHIANRPVKPRVAANKRKQQLPAFSNEPLSPLSNPDKKKTALNTLILATYDAYWQQQNRHVLGSPAAPATANDTLCLLTLSGSRPHPEILDSNGPTLSPTRLQKNQSSFFGHTTQI
jgi:hypothetical protein